MNRRWRIWLGLWLSWPVWVSTYLQPKQRILQLQLWAMWDAGRLPVNDRLNTYFLTIDKSSIAVFLLSFPQHGPVLSFNDSYPVPCIEAYRLTGEDEVTLPPECPPTLPPVQRCNCPDPETVKAAVGLRSSRMHQTSGRATMHALPVGTFPCSVFAMQDISFVVAPVLYITTVAFCAVTWSILGEYRALWSEPGRTVSCDWKRSGL